MTAPAAAPSAMPAGLRYAHDDRPGITRSRHGKAFRYVGPDGTPVRDPATLERIKGLGVPPGWEQVWVCPHANGHIQAVGRDARGRKQYRYHHRWRAARDGAKYDRVMQFAAALPAIRATVETHLSLPGLPREKVLAAVVRLLEVTLIRVGNDEYARTNQSYGLTTLQDGHADISGNRVRFQFRGKSGVNHEVTVTDRRLARVVKRCQNLPGQELFQYVDAAGAVRDVGSDDVNAYLREVAGDEFSAKDFRTWAGTVLAAMALREFEQFDSHVQAKKNIVAAVRRVAERLGNTPAVCRKCYVHPDVIDAYLDGAVLEATRQRADEAMAHLHGLPPEEAAVVALLQRRLAAGA